MGEVVRAFHGTRDIEGVMREGSIKSNYLQYGDDTFYYLMRGRYSTMVDSLAAEGREILSRDGSLGTEDINERLDSFPEAIADLMELWRRGGSSEYTKLKRNLFVYFTTALNTARHYADGTAGNIGGVVEVDLDLDLIRQGLNCYKNHFEVIEFPRAVSLDRTVNIYVRRSDFLRINNLRSGRGSERINLKELEK